MHKDDIDVLSGIDEASLKAALHSASLFGHRHAELSEPVRQALAERLKDPSNAYLTELLRLVDDIRKEQEDQLQAVADEMGRTSAEHEPILAKIRHSAPLREKSDAIERETSKLAEVKQLETEMNALSTELDALSSGFTKALNEKLAYAREVISAIDAHPFADGDDKLGLMVSSRCKSVYIQSILRDQIRYQSNPEVRNFINDDTFTDTDMGRYVSHLTALLQQARAGSLELKADHTLAGLVQALLSSTIYLNYDLQFGGDSFNVMSPGKRALALLRVLVELDQSRHPIILDQPEDDLDNRSVFEGLATYLKEKKVDRQIIVVTHNPNVVVGADSEYVIVANQSGQESNQDNEHFRFEYIYGGLENSFEEEDNPYVLQRQGIREHVCEILDGGEVAFRRRERLYTGFKKLVRRSVPDELMDDVA